MGRQESHCHGCRGRRGGLASCPNASSSFLPSIAFSVMNHCSRFHQRAAQTKHAQGMTNLKLPHDRLMLGTLHDHHVQGDRGGKPCLLLFNPAFLMHKPVEQKASSMRHRRRFQDGSGTFYTSAKCERGCWKGDKSSTLQGPSSLQKGRAAGARGAPGPAEPGGLSSRREPLADSLVLSS